VKVRSIFSTSFREEKDESYCWGSMFSMGRRGRASAEEGLALQEKSREGELAGAP